ncbi:hypothetical protein M0R45_036304 [Rubus argutus]|uniref:Uncharacterized protein n=1 Tax=Rubus argutus TaxID=59490 RepID=A0AAW1VXH0_RUBAR
MRGLEEWVRRGPHDGGELGDMGTPAGSCGLVWQRGRRQGLGSVQGRRRRQVRRARALMDRRDRWRHGAMKHGVREEQRRSEMVKPEIDGEQ